MQQITFMIIFFQLRRVLILVLFFLLSLLMLTTRPYAQSEKLNKTEILKSLFLNKNENSSVFIQLGHSRGVQSLKVSNNGTSVLSGGEDNTVKLWDSKTGRIKKTLKGHSGIVFSVDFSPDDLMALSGSTDNTLKLWDLIQGKSVKTYRGHTGYVTAVKFFPNGQYALSGSSDKTLRLWDIREGIQIHVFEGHNDAIFSIAISSSLKHIFSGGSKGKINLWNIESGEILKTFKHSDNVSVNSIISLPNDLFISGSADGAIKIWHQDQEEPLKEFFINDKKGEDLSIDSLAIGPDGRYIYSAISDNSLKIIDLYEGKIIKTIPLKQSIFSLALSRQNQLYAGRGDGNITVRNAISGEEIKNFKSNSNEIRSAHMTLDGKYSVNYESRNSISIWDLEKGKRINLFHSPSSQITDVRISPDFKFVLAGTRDGSIIVFDPHSGDKLKTLKGHNQRVNDLDISMDSQLVLSGSSDKQVKLWELSTGKVIKTFKGHLDEILSVTFSPDQKLAVTGSLDNTLRIWDLSSGEEVDEYSLVKVNDDQDIYKGGVSSIAINRKYLIWVSGKNSIAIINRSTKIKKNLSVSSSQNETFQEICCVALSQKGYLLHGRRNGTIHIWNIHKGTVVNQLDGHLRNVSSLTVTRDGRYALSSSWDGTSILWEIESGRKLFQMASFNDDEWVVLTAEGFFNASPQGEKHINLLKNGEIVNMQELDGLLNRPDILMEIRKGAEIKKMFRETLMGTQ